MRTRKVTWAARQQPYAMTLDSITLVPEQVFSSVQQGPSRVCDELRSSPCPPDPGLPITTSPGTANLAMYLLSFQLLWMAFPSLWQHSPCMDFENSTVEILTAMSERFAADMISAELSRQVVALYLSVIVPRLLSLVVSIPLASNAPPCLVVAVRQTCCAVIHEPSFHEDLFHIVEGHMTATPWDLSEANVAGALV